MFRIELRPDAWFFLNSAWFCSFASGKAPSAFSSDTELAGVTPPSTLTNTKMSLGCW